MSRFTRMFRRRFRNFTFPLSTLCVTGIGSMHYNKSTKNDIDNESHKLTLDSTGLPFIEHNNSIKDRPDLPIIPLSEVRDHYSEDAGGVWVTFRGGVYDVTEFLDGHPGRRGRVEMVGGGDLEPWWEIYRLHYRGHVVDFLDKNYRIGTLNDSDQKTIELNNKNNGKLYNYYRDLEDGDPARHYQIQHCTYAPYCGECPINLMTKSFYTPNELFYCRNHAFVPNIDPDEYELEVIIDNKVHKFTLNDLKTKFTKYEVATTLQCAANRSEDYHGVGKGHTKGMFNPPHWRGGALSTAKWGGVRMRDLLSHCGIDVDNIALNKKYNKKYQHAHFKAYDEDETGNVYGASTFLDKIIDPYGDCLVAYEMNGRTLPRDHGFPCRAIIPGHAGARQPKWLHKIILAPEASGVSACLGFGTQVTFEDSLKHWPPLAINTEYLDKPQQPSINGVVQEMPVQSLISIPAQNEIIRVDSSTQYIDIEGVSWSGGGIGIHRVDLSIDDGDTFIQADLLNKPCEQSRRGQWAWTLFKQRIQLTGDIKKQLKLGKMVDLILTSKAIDKNYNVQPATRDGQINPRAVAVNHWYKVHVTLLPIVQDTANNYMNNNKKTKKNRRKKKNEKERVIAIENRPSEGVFHTNWENHGWTHPNGVRTRISDTADDENVTDWINILNESNEKLTSSDGISAEIDWSYYQNLNCQPYYWQPHWTHSRK